MREKGWGFAMYIVMCIRLDDEEVSIFHVRIVFFRYQHADVN